MRRHRMLSRTRWESRFALQTLDHFVRPLLHGLQLAGLAFGTFLPSNGPSQFATIQIHTGSVGSHYASFAAPT